MIWALAVAPASGQTVGATPLPTTRKPRPKVAHLRFFNALPLDGGTLELVSASTTTGPAVQVAVPSNFYVPYVTLPPVRAAFNVFRIGNRQSAVKSLDIPLKADAYFTILAFLQPNGRPTVELINDLPDLTSSPSNRLTIHQFLQGAQVVVTAAGQIRSDPLAYGATQTLAALPDGTVPLSMVATLTAGGASKLVNQDATFQSYRHLSIYLVTDPYDRLRPREAIDGPSKAEEDAIREEALATSPQ